MGKERERVFHSLAETAMTRAWLDQSQKPGLYPGLPFACHGPKFLGHMLLFLCH